VTILSISVLLNPANPGPWPPAEACRVERYGSGGLPGCPGPREVRRPGAAGPTFLKQSADSLAYLGNISA